MRRNEINTPAAAEEKNAQEPFSVSTYKIGHTTYTVNTYFNPKSKETLEDVLGRLIMKDIEKLSA